MGSRENAGSSGRLPIRPESLDKPNQDYPSYKLRIRRLLLNLGGVRRIHIVGAARSGTTMLHYAMIAFEGTRLFDAETDVRWSPSLSDSARLCIRSMASKAPQILITKRRYGWYREDSINWLIKHATDDNIGIIHIVRNPRDSLTSLHSATEGREYYLEAERWVRSVLSAEYLFQSLENHPLKLVIRYEDVLMSPEDIQEIVAQTFDLRLRSGILSWATLNDNLDAAGVSAKMAAAMHGVRDFDPASIGKSKSDAEKVAYFNSLSDDPKVSGHLTRFMRQYGYEDGH